MVSKLDVRKHVLVAKHSKLSDKDKKQIFEKYKINGKQLPKIMKEDPAIAHLNAKPGDVIKIERESMTAGTSFFYREIPNV